MKARWLPHLTIFLLIALTSCSARSPREEEFSHLKGEKRYELLASTPVGGDRLEVWKESTGDYFGSVLLAAYSGSGRFIDFCPAYFSSSMRPFFQNAHYAALVASQKTTGERDVFFVYDSADKKFLSVPVKEHVHDGFVIATDRIYFSSCKTPKPLGRVDIPTCQIKMFGEPAPQGAAFYVVDNHVYAGGAPPMAFRVDENDLVPVKLDLSKREPAGMTLPVTKAERYPLGP